MNRVCGSIAVLAGTAALMVGLSSCAILEGPSPETPVRTSPVIPDAPLELVPGSTADENLEYFQQILSEYSAGEQPIEGQPIVDAIAAAGFDKADMQVSHDFSRTQLTADSIFVAVRLADTCLLGQLVTENREWAAHADEAAGPDNNICLIGETRPIDW